MVGWHIYIYMFFKWCFLILEVEGWMKKILSGKRLEVEFFVSGTTGARVS